MAKAQYYFVIVYFLHYGFITEHIFVLSRVWIPRILLSARIPETMYAETKPLPKHPSLAS